MPFMAFKEKLLSSLPPVEAGTRLYKRYYVTSAAAVITPEVEKAALGLLPELVPEMDGTPPAGFVVLHRGGDGAAILGGAGNMDEGELRGYHAITLRLHDPGSGLWSLYWITSRTGAAIEPPVSGRFTGAVGDFLGPDTHNGKPVVCRYRWTVVNPGACLWEQALSPDDGKTWETNWHMNLSRTDIKGGTDGRGGSPG